MIDYVFYISTQIRSHISSFIFDDNSIKCSSKKHDSYHDFRQNWDSEFATTKSEISYDKIKKITKLENNNLVSIEHKVGILPTWFMFYFDNPLDSDKFFDYLVKEKHYQKKIEQLTFINSISKVDIFLVAIVVIIALGSYFFGDETRNLNITFGIAGIFIIAMLIRAWLRSKKSSSLVTYWSPNR